MPRTPSQPRGAQIPSVIDRYQLVSRIGQGGMAEVFHARMQGIGGFERDVAVKVLLPEYSSEPDFVHMLLDEARIAGSIGHPCVVGVLDVGRHNDLFYLVMEHVAGGDLRSILRTSANGRVRLTAALFIVSEVLRGLHAVHCAVDREGVPRKIVHRDVSPANVLIDRMGTVKLGDFGIAHASSRITRTRQGAVKGKLRYMAPEQLCGQPVDHRADLYAIAMVLCEMLLGLEACEPRRMTAFGAVFAWSRRIAPDRVPSDVADILDRATAEQPAQRYSDASVFRRDIVAALHRRSPGYGADELARELAGLSATPAPTPSELTPAVDTDADAQVIGGSLDGPDGDGTDGVPFASNSIGLFMEEQKATAPFHPESMSELGSPSSSHSLAPSLPPVAQPLYGVAPKWLSDLPQWKKLGAVAAAAGAAILSITLAIVLGGSSAPPIAPLPTVAAPVVREAPRVQLATGTLSVEGPPGTAVMIGTTSYPAAPCQLELPAGDYQVRLKRRNVRARAVIRHVTIEPGQEIALRL